MLATSSLTALSIYNQLTQIVRMTNSILIGYLNITFSSYINPSPNTPNLSFEEYNTTSKTIDILNKDCRRSISAILTWVLENVKISVRPLNSIGN